jgi:hypothetical protein
MTLIHYDTPLIRRPPATAVSAQATRTVVSALGRLFTHLADARRRRLDQRALENLPFDLRKDLGWPAGDIGRH